MKKVLLIVFILSAIRPVRLDAQKIMTLKECYDLARDNSALVSEKDAYAEIWKLKDNNLSRGWLPSLDLNANILYNSDGVDIGSAIAVPVPGLKSMPHEQYKVTLDINQVIYDGGSIKGARYVENAERLVNEKQTEAEMYKLKAQVNNYYFGLLLTARQKDLLTNYLEIINKRISSMLSALDNGVILKSDVDVLSSEKIKIEQQISETDIRKKTLISVLSDITGTNIDHETTFILPSLKGEPSFELLRPELQLFDLKKEQLEAGMNIIESKRMPKAFGFATLGYGRPPGTNFFEDSFQPYYLLGAGIKWNIFDWNKVKNEKQLIVLQQGIIENRKADLSENLKRLLASKNAEIESLEALIETDKELIILRKRITATAESQYASGTITATEYLNEMNSERQAVINSEIHKITLVMARIEYINISGKDIK